MQRRSDVYRHVPKQASIPLLIGAALLEGNDDARAAPLYTAICREGNGNYTANRCRGGETSNHGDLTDGYLNARPDAIFAYADLSWTKLMDEAKKTNLLRTDDFKQRYFAGQVIDIGCGADLVVPHAIPFDLEHGDAQRVLDYINPESFDCVHSSHCLEHMDDVKAALEQWWALVRPGGYLIIVVPHEDLYEQGAWPSLFNLDHKATFNLGRRTESSAVSYDIRALVRDLDCAEIIQCCVQDQGLDYRLIRRPVTALGRLLYKLEPRRRYLFWRLMRRGFPVYRLDNAIDYAERLLGKPIDQTKGCALAQIQVVARKSPRELRLE